MSGDLPSIFRSTDLSPIVLLVSLLTAAALGAGHALTPGHGKTLMAAYLVGHARDAAPRGGSRPVGDACRTRSGSSSWPRSSSAPQGFLPPDLVVRSAPLIAAISIVAIGGWMLFGEGRRRWRIRAAEAAHAAGPRPRRGARPRARALARPRAHRRPRARPIPAPRRRTTTTATPPASTATAASRHSHLPPTGTTISWRSLFVLGLAGGLIPSTSALLILLGSIAAGRPAFGFVLVDRLRARDGAGHGRDRARARPRPWSARSRRLVVAPRAGDRRTCRSPPRSSSSASGST